MGEKQRIEELEGMIDRLLSWAISNRGSDHAFVTCRTVGRHHDWPVILIEAETLIGGFNPPPGYKNTRPKR